jgi:hypothetical protein
MPIFHPGPGGGSPVHHQCLCRRCWSLEPLPSHRWSWSPRGIGKSLAGHDTLGVDTVDVEKMWKTPGRIWQYSTFMVWKTPRRTIQEGSDSLTWFWGNSSNLSSVSDRVTRDFWFMELGSTVGKCVWEWELLVLSHQKWSMYVYARYQQTTIHLNGFTWWENLEQAMAFYGFLTA